MNKSSAYPQAGSREDNIRLLMNGVREYSLINPDKGGWSLLASFNDEVLKELVGTCRTLNTSVWEVNKKLKALKRDIPVLCDSDSVLYPNGTIVKGPGAPVSYEQPKTETETGLFQPMVKAELPEDILKLLNPEEPKPETKVEETTTEPKAEEPKDSGEPQFLAPIKFLDETPEYNVDDEGLKADAAFPPKKSKKKSSKKDNGGLKDAPEA